MDIEKPRDQKKFFGVLKRVVKHVPFSRDLLAMYYAAIDRATPKWAKATILGAIAYFVLPIDVIPDVLVGIGFTDDAAVIMAAYKAIVAHVTDTHKDRAAEWMDRNT